MSFTQICISTAISRGKYICRKHNLIVLLQAALLDPLSTDRCVFELWNFSSDECPSSSNALVWFLDEKESWLLEVILFDWHYLMTKWLQKAVMNIFLSQGRPQPCWLKELNRARADVLKNCSAWMHLVPVTQSQNATAVHWCFFPCRIIIVSLWFEPLQTIRWVLDSEFSVSSTGQRPLAGS